MIYTPHNMKEHNIESIRLFDEEQREIHDVTEIDTDMKSYKALNRVGDTSMESQMFFEVDIREFILTPKHTIKIKYKE